MKTLSDPTRLRIIRALIEGPLSVSRLATRTGLPVNHLSHHLGRMRMTGLVTCTRDGRRIIYKIAERVASKNGLDLGCARIEFRPLA